MIYLEKYNLNLEAEWNNYIVLFDKYIQEEAKDDNFEYQNMTDNQEYKVELLKVVNRKQNPLHVCKIMNDDVQIGFVDYVCWVNEDGKSLIGNFYIKEEYRNHGYGSIVLNLVEKALREIGAKFIDITPSNKAINLYLRNGFIKTNDKSQENGDIVYRKVLAK